MKVIITERQLNMLKKNNYISEEIDNLRDMKPPRIFKVDGSVVEYAPKNGKFLTKDELQKILGIGGIGFYRLPDISVRTLHSSDENGNYIQHPSFNKKMLMIVTKSQSHKRGNKGLSNVHGAPIESINGNFVVTDDRWLEKSPIKN